MIEPSTLEEVRAQLEAAPSTPDRHLHLEPLTAAALCALPDPPVEDELLGSLLVRGNRTVIGAHTGEGKTTLAFQMVRAVVLGEEFLGYTGRGGRALIVDAEQGERTVKRRLREAGLGDSDAVDVVRVPDGLSLDRNPGEIAAFAALLERGGYDLVLLDPLYKLHAGDSNDERPSVDLMRRLDAWRVQFNFALILTTHLRKAPPQGAKLTIHEFFGSSAFLRGAEVVLGIGRLRAGYSRLYFIKDRDGDLPIGDQWGLLFESEDGGYSRDPDERKPPTPERLLELRAADPQITQAQAAAALELSERTVRKYWQAADPEDAEPQAEQEEFDF